jgi:DDE superfamily endonuclease
VGAVQHSFEWCSVDGAVAPTTGERVFSALPSLHAETFQLCIEAFAQAFPDRLNLLRLDHSGAPTARPLSWPDKVGCVWVPPSCPEFHPLERVWRDLKDQRAWKRFPDLHTRQDAGGISSGTTRPPPCNPFLAIPILWRPFMPCAYSEVILGSSFQDFRQPSR